MTEERQLLLRALAVLEYLMGVIEGAQVVVDLSGVAELTAEIQDQLRGQPRGPVN